MAGKVNIRVAPETREALRQLKRGDDTYDDVIRWLLRVAEAEDNPLADEFDVMHAAHDPMVKKRKKGG